MYDWKKNVAQYFYILAGSRGESKKIIVHYLRII